MCSFLGKQSVRYSRLGTSVNLAFFERSENSDFGLTIRCEFTDLINKIKALYTHDEIHPDILL